MFYHLASLLLTLALLLLSHLVVIVVWAIASRRGSAHALVRTSIIEIQVRGWISNVIVDLCINERLSSELSIPMQHLRSRRVTG